MIACTATLQTRKTERDSAAEPSSLRVNPHVRVRRNHASPSPNPKYFYIERFHKALKLVQVLCAASPCITLICIVTAHSKSSPTMSACAPPPPPVWTSFELSSLPTTAH